MKQITKEMLKIYEPVSSLDWLNYQIARVSDLTFHHIQKRSDGGKRIISNGALLLPIPHQYLHIIEYRDIKTYVAINKIFEYINRQRHEPTEEQRMMIEYLLSTFEKEHRWDKGSKGKLLIKAKYLNRSTRL